METLKSYKLAKSSAEVSKICLEGIADAINKLEKKRIIKFEDIVENGAQVFFAGLGYLFFANVSVDSAKQLASELSHQTPADQQEVENTKKALVGDVLNIASSLFSEKRNTITRTKRRTVVKRIIKAKK